MSDTRRAVFSERMKAARLSRDITQDVLSDMSGVAREMIARYETQKAFPAIETLVKISQVLDVSIDYLLGLTDNMDTDRKPTTLAAQPVDGKEAELDERTQQIIEAGINELRKQLLRDIQNAKKPQD